MKYYDCIFLDRDGTINPDPPPGYISKLENFKFYNFTFEALKILSKITKNFIIVTNQSGVSRGDICEADLIRINNFIIREFLNHSIPLLDIYYCTDHPDDVSINRKPGVGMFLSANKDFDINLSNCLMIGDSLSDMKPAFKLNMDSMLVMTGNGKVDKNCFEKDSSPTFYAKNILNGAKLLVR